MNKEDVIEILCDKCSGEACIGAGLQVCEWGKGVAQAIIDLLPKGDDEGLLAWEEWLYDSKDNIPFEMLDELTQLKLRAGYEYDKEFRLKAQRDLTERNIIEKLEKQLFRDNPTEDEVCHLAYDMWKDITEGL